MEEKYAAPEASEVELEDQEEEIIEKRYVAAPKWKRLLAFLIDFLIYAGLIFVLNSYVTKPYLYSRVYSPSTREEKFNQDAAEIAKQYNTDEFTFITDEGVYCTPEFSGYVCNTAYGSYKVGDVLTYAEYASAGIIADNISKWDVDPCYETAGKFYLSTEYTELATIYQRDIYRFDQLTMLIDSFYLLILVYIIPAMIFKNGRTIGKKIFGLLVVDHVGQPIKRMMYLFRTLIGFWALEYVTSIFTYYVVILISGIVSYINHKQKSIHDIIFGTCVVSEEMEERVVIFEKVEEPIEPEAIIDDEEYY